MDKDKIAKGMKITKQFQGGISEEIMHLRKGLIALNIKIDKLVSQNDTKYKRIYTVEDDDAADITITNLIELNKKVELFKKSLEPVVEEEVIEELTEVFR